MDPLRGSSWSAPATVAGFVESPPNQTLIAFAAGERARGAARAVDVGCGAGRNLVPLACQGWTVVGLDLSRPMLDAATARIEAEDLTKLARVVLAPMDELPVVDWSVDLIVAHGIWNLARTGDEFRRGVREAARVARRDAALFVFTFSRQTLSPTARPVRGRRSSSPSSRVSLSASSPLTSSSQRWPRPASSRMRPSPSPSTTCRGPARFARARCPSSSRRPLLPARRSAMRPPRPLLAVGAENLDGGVQALGYTGRASRLVRRGSSSRRPCRRRHGRRRRSPGRRRCACPPKSISG